MIWEFAVVFALMGACIVVGWYCRGWFDPPPPRHAAPKRRKYFPAPVDDQEAEPTGGDA